MQDHDLNDIFESKYLKASDLNGKEWTMVIASAAPHIIGQGEKAETKVLITFQGAKKGFIANRTNCKRIAFRHGTKLSGWIGKEIILYPELIDFAGDAVEAIRVKHPVEREQVTSGNGTATVQHTTALNTFNDMRPAKPPLGGGVGGGGNMDDEIPFAPEWR